MVSYKIVLLLISIAFAPLAHAYVPNLALESEDQTFSTAELEPYAGARIMKIRIHGLVHTEERAVRWLLGDLENDKFDPELWIKGIKKLYNTAVLYDIRTEIKEVAPGAQKNIEIDLYLLDKWAIMPYVVLQGGGGSTQYGGGIFDANLDGYFTNASIGATSFDHTMGYDLNLLQQWSFDTDWAIGLDLSKTGFPTPVQNRAGDTILNFTWFRTQEQLLVGHDIKENIRAFSYIEIFQDHIRKKDSGVPTHVLSGTQYRLRPNLVFGKSNYTNYLEQGSELTFAPTSANFFSASRNYNQFVVNYKRTKILRGNANFAYFMSLGIMNSAPLPYQFRLGGLDTIRGFSTNRFMGTAYGNARIEYRPLLYSTRTQSLDAFVVQGNIFTDLGWINGNINPSGQGIGGRNALSMASAGIGLRGILVKYVGAFLRLDFAHTITPREGYDISFGVTQFF